jgi:hypothetical protein
MIETWTSQNGKTQKIQDMATPHISNCIKKLKALVIPVGNIEALKAKQEYIDAFISELKRRDPENKPKGK